MWQAGDPSGPHDACDEVTLMGTEVINVGDTVEFTFDLGGVATTLTGEVKQWG